MQHWVSNCKFGMNCLKIFYFNWTCKMMMVDAWHPHCSIWLVVLIWNAHSAYIPVISLVYQKVPQERIQEENLTFPGSTVLSLYFFLPVGTSVYHGLRRKQSMFEMLLALLMCFMLSFSLHDSSFLFSVIQCCVCYEPLCLYCTENSFRPIRPQKSEEECLFLSLHLVPLRCLLMPLEAILK